MTIESPRNNIASIQCLRGLAALMVVIYHLQNQTTRLQLNFPNVHALASGVDIFFVISGFIMWYTTASKPDSTARDFILNRAARIIPLYWFVTLAFSSILLIAPHLFVTSVWNMHHVVMSFLFLASKHPLTQRYEPVLIPGWTLNLEMFFYVIFAGAIALGRDVRERAIIVLFALTVIVLYGQVEHPSGVLSFYTSDIIAEFAGGIVLAILYVRGFRLHGVLASMLLLGGLATLLLTNIYPTPLLRSVEWGIPAFAVVAAAVFGRAISAYPLERLGDWSYSLYLTHVITLAASQKIWTTIGTGLPLAVFPVFAIAACVTVAALCFYFVEGPLTAAAKLILGLRRSRDLSRVTVT